MNKFFITVRFLLTGFAFLAFSLSVASAADFPFSDVPVSDSIYSDLKKLYERGVVDTPSDGKFHSEALMDRDEFVAIAVWVGCRKCLTPTMDDLLRYREIPFLDFEAKSPYFYCVSYAKEKSIVNGYSIPGATVYTCQDNKPWNGVPFCAQNRISRIEAAAMLLRQAGLWNDAMNSSSFEHKRNFKDVDPYWYGYAQKGTDIGILNPDASGSLRPNEYVTKREFVKMAAIIYSLNMCEAKGMNSSASATDSSDAMASEIRVLDSAAQCSASAPDAKINNAATSEYNFYGMPTLSGATYSWTFFPADGSGTSITASGQCLAKQSLPAGRWIAKLTITDASWKTSTSYAEVPFGSSAGNGTSAGNNVPLSLSVSANPLSVPAGVPLNLWSIASWWTGPYSYRWDLWDGTVTNLSDPKHAYSSAGSYGATLIITDAVGNRAMTKVVVSVTENPDIDGDGIPNLEDTCPLVFGPKSNKGCPPVSPYASFWSGWSEGSSSGGGSSGVGSSGSAFGLGATLTLAGVWGRCEYSYAAPKGAIFGKAACSSCPCSYELDFLAELRRCDMLFPTILSPDKKDIYSRGPLVEVR